MPRPKILPENRVRAYRACNSCKASKIRCDSKVPCENCVKRGRESQCCYQAGSSAATRKAKRQSIAIQQRASPLFEPLSTISVPSLTAGSSRGSISEPRNEQPRTTADMGAVPTPSSGVSPMRQDGSSEAATTTQETSMEDQDSPEEHFIAGPNGEKLYLGDHASLSFLDFLRHSLKQLVGDTSFTDGQQHNPMLEPELDETPGANITMKPSEKRALYESYLAVSSGILHLFPEDEAEKLLSSTEANSTSRSPRHDLAAMDMALAIGAQARASGPTDSQYATACFIRARTVAFEDMLANPSVASVRLFVLLSFFTLGACRQTPASIYLGIASKAAVVLGLHQPMSRKMMGEGESYYSRLRTWHSLCIMDVVTSSLLGRPCTVPRATRHSIHSLPLDALQPSFNAMLKAAALLDDICRVLSRGVLINAPTAQELLTSLRHWSRDLPPSLRRFECKDSSTLTYGDQRAVIGNIHVSSMYYFSVILVTRPFLTRCLMPNIRRQAGTECRVMTDPAQAALAQVCTTSAVYMGQLCRHIASMLDAWDLPLATLSLFKTWAFSAGLVLGFSIFAGEPRNDLNEAFTGITQFLAKTGEASLQSRLYSETLTGFSDAIALYRRMTRETVLAPNQFVEQILAINTSPSEVPVSVNKQAPQMEFPSWDHVDSTNTDLLFGTTPTNWAAQLEAAEASLEYQDWDNLGMQFSDNFGLDFRA